MADFQSFDIQIPLIDEKLKDMRNMVVPPQDIHDRMTAASEMGSTHGGDPKKKEPEYVN